MFTGIVCGIFTALFQNLGYIFSGNYVKAGRSPVMLLAWSQILMGAASIPLLLLLFFFGEPRSFDFLIPAFFVCAGSGGGQYFFFRAGRKMESSRISSLMGLRVVILALISSFFFKSAYNYAQWSGIFLAALSAFAMNFEGFKFKSAGLGDMACSLGCYCVSDLNVASMVRGFEMSSLLAASLFALCVVNIPTAAALLPKVLAKPVSGECAAAAPYAGSWMLKQLFLYICYAVIGPVHANVVLSIRGPLAVLISFVTASVRPEAAGGNAAPVRVWIQRGAATLLMTAAIILYTLG